MSFFAQGATIRSTMVTVEIESGRVRGRRIGDALSFLGVPYAADTGGAHRFLAPRPVPSWTGVRDAFVPGPRCPQPIEKLPASPVFSWYAEDSRFSEGCCALNVYTPGVDGATRRPVIFYVHGGGYASGGSGSLSLDGSELAAQGELVVVTVNHRLNLFGYTGLALAGSSGFEDAGNAGHLDLVAALQWVKRNIASFGGDPDNVTLCGQSGGGNKVMGLLVMPAAQGLFRRAINMSGASGVRMATAEETEPFVHCMLKHLGIAGHETHRLQQLPVEALQAARNKALVQMRRDGSQPVIDGRHVMASPFTPEGLALHSCVPLMMGTTETEATFFLGRDRRNFVVDDDEVKRRVRTQFGLHEMAARELLAAYREEAPDRTALDVLSHLSSDVLSRGPILQAAEAKASAGQAPVYVYNFGWQVPQDGGVWGSPHTADIPFVFGTLKAARAMTGRGAGPCEVSRNMMAAFAAFAHTGTPDNPRMPAWKPYDATSRATMVIDRECRQVNDLHGRQRTASAPLLGELQANLLRGPLIRGLDRTTAGPAP